MTFVGDSALGLAATQEIFTRHYATNFAQNAKTQALVQSVAGVVGLALNPVIAGLTDAYGRRPMMLFSQVASLLMCASKAQRSHVLLSRRVQSSFQAYPSGFRSWP